jgi:hypothetical protein
MEGFKIDAFIRMQIPLTQETRKSEGPMGEALLRFPLSLPSTHVRFMLQIPLYPLLQHRCLCNERSYRDLTINKDETSSAK